MVLHTLGNCEVKADLIAPIENNVTFRQIYFLVPLSSLIEIYTSFHYFFGAGYDPSGFRFLALNRH